MNINVHMASATKAGETSDSRVQESKKLCMEAKTIVYEMEMRNIAQEERQIRGWEISSPGLKNFIIENSTQSKWTWGEIVEILEKELKRLEEENRMVEMKREEYERIKTEIKDELKEGWSQRRRTKISSVRREDIVCFKCNQKGHIARMCSNESNKFNENYLKFLKIKESRKQYGNFTSQERKSRKLCENKSTFINESEDRESLMEDLDQVNLEELVKEYPEVFNLGRKVEFCPIEKCSIKTRGNQRVVKRGQNIPQALRKRTKEYLDDLERRQVISESSSQWRNPIRAIEKPNGEIRLVSNFMALNDLVEKDPFELANIRDVIRATTGSKWFTVIDLKEGFYHIEIEREDRHKTAFEFDGKVYEWNSMVMGFKNSPQILQRVMNKILNKRRGQGVEVYMDDIVIHARTIKEHDRILKWVFNRLKENKMRINKTKLQFRERRIKLLGVTIDGRIREPNEMKKNEALDYPIPRNVSELRRFLGLAGWFREFIKDYSIITGNLTECLKGKRKELIWNEQLNQEFENIKQSLRNMKQLILPNYEKEFILKTDASNTGMGAVLLQRNGKGELAPVQWASKKFTATEKRYGISEKEMFAVFWAIKKFEYELRGRRFKLITDHKALEEIRRKPSFNNDRINRWIEKIQEFDFVVEYNRGELLVVPDALSRLYESDGIEEERMKIKKERGDKLKEGKWNKRVKIVDGKEIWTFDNGKTAQIPPIEERKLLIQNIHDKLGHRGIESIYYQIKGEYYWPGIKETIKNVIKQCEVCQINNRKCTGGSEFVTTSRPFEKVAIDLIEERQEGKYILIGIDYFTRGIAAKVIQNKTTIQITEALKEWIKAGWRIDELISDNGREFLSSAFKNMCREYNINHSVVSVESHRSNGRVERVIRTLREGLAKYKEGSIENRISRLIGIYNNSFHSAIGCTPREAYEDRTGDVTIENSDQGKYKQKFKIRYREQFELGSQVRIAKHDNFKAKIKESKGRFLEVGKVIYKCRGDSYLVQKENGMICKRRHYDLKKIIV